MSDITPLTLLLAILCIRNIMHVNPDIDINAGFSGGPFSIVGGADVFG